MGSPGTDLTDALEQVRRRRDEHSWIHSDSAILMGRLIERLKADFMWGSQAIEDWATIYKESKFTIFVCRNLAILMIVNKGKRELAIQDLIESYGVVAITTDDFHAKQFSADRELLLNLWPCLDVFMESIADPFVPNAFSIEDIWSFTN